MPVRSSVKMHSGTTDGREKGNYSVIITVLSAFTP